MNSTILLGIIGVLIGIAGLVYAFFVNRSKKKLSDYIKAQNWHLYAKTNNASGFVQLALAKYRTTNQDNIDSEVLEQLSKADAFSQDVLKDVIRQIQVSEPIFNANAIQSWVDEHRIDEAHLSVFLALTPANKTIQ